MTFNEIAQAIQDRDAICGAWLTLERAKEKAAAEVLEGFRDLQDALDCLESLRDTGNVFFTLYGYEIDAGALEATIRYQEDSNA